MSSHASGQAGWPRHAWLVPAVLAASAIGLLCWGAWVYGYDPRWLDGARTWWLPLLRPDQDLTLVATTALLVAGLAAYWWPRRREQQPIALIAVAVLVLVAAALGTTSYVPCRGQMSTVGITFWILQLYVGQ